MKSKLSLAQYVKKRNGVPLGASGSMTNMLSRSFGAASFLSAPHLFRFFGTIGIRSGVTIYHAMSCVHLRVFFLFR